METRTETRAVEQPEAGPLSPSQALPTAIMFAIAMLGGVISFYRKWKEGNVRAFNFTELLGELFVSGVCGVLSYWMFKGIGVNEWLTAAGVGIVGHMGSRFLFLAEKTMGDLANKWSNANRESGIGNRESGGPTP
jgi:hypothetical protein